MKTKQKPSQCQPKGSLLEARYEPIVFRGTLKPREGDGRLGRLKMDTETAHQLGASNVGLFVENCPGFERLVCHFRDLSASAKQTIGSWVMVASSKEVAENLQSIWRSSDSEGSDRYCSESHASSLDEAVIITTPELLNKVELGDRQVACILVVDYACHIHKCRGFSEWSARNANDRPQRIVDFRISHRVEDWCPPMVFFTNRPALSVNTHQMLSPYCLEAFRYIDGGSIKLGQLPTDSAQAILVG